MFGSVVLEVAIGLVFLYLSLSLISSALNEYYSALLDRRSNHLRDSLFILFNKDDPKGMLFLLEFYKHPLVGGLAPQKGQMISTNVTPDIPSTLSPLQKIIVLPARRIADFLGLLLGSVGKIKAALDWLGQVARNPYGMGGLNDLRHRELQAAAKATPTYIPDRLFSEVIFSVLKDDKSALGRLKAVLNEELANLQVVSQGLTHEDSANLLSKTLEELAPKVRDFSDESKDVVSAVEQTKLLFKTLVDVLPQVDPSYLPTTSLLASAASRATTSSTPVSTVPAGSKPPVSTAEEDRLALTKGVLALPDGAAQRELVLLLGSGSFLGRVASLRRTWNGAESYVAWLQTSVDDNEKKRKETYEAVLPKIDEARLEAEAAGPVLPDDRRIQEHVLSTLENSLTRLRAAIAVLPAALSSPLEAKLVESVKAIDDFKSNMATSTWNLKDLQDKATLIFSELRGTLDGLKNQPDATKVGDWVEREALAIVAAKDNLLTIAKLRDSIKALPNSQIKSALAALADEALDDLDQVKRNIESWFNDSMDRVSGWYKRNTQVILLLIAIFLTVSLNADTFKFADRLWYDKAMREQVTTEASNLQGKDLAAVNSIIAPKTGTPKSVRSLTQLPLGWSDDEKTDLGISGSFVADLKNESLNDLGRTRIRQYAQRLGRGIGRVLYQLFLTSNGQMKFAGLAITAIAISMGAPFWFDILNKLVNVRSAGLQPKRSEDNPVITRVPPEPLPTPRA